MSISDQVFVAIFATIGGMCFAGSLLFREYRHHLRSVGGVCIGFVILIACTGCSVLPDGAGSQLSHTSGLLVQGHDSKGQLREDSLDTLDGYLYWDRGSWYAEAGVGYKLREGGFYVKDSRLVGTVKFGKRWRFDK